MSKMNQAGVDSPGYMSSIELDLARVLDLSLDESFYWRFATDGADTIEAGTVGENRIRYTPDFVIGRQGASHVLLLEVKTAQWLSLANVVKLKLISAACKNAGDEFLLLLHGQDHPSKTDQLKGKGVNAVWVGDATAALPQIKRYIPLS